MSVRDLIPWGRNDGNQVPSVFRDSERDPFLSLHREVNRLFDDVFRGFGSNLPAFNGASTFGGGWPSVEISNGEKEIKLTAEVPGLEEKDIEVLLDDGLTLGRVAAGRRTLITEPGCPVPGQADHQTAENHDSQTEHNKWPLDGFIG